MNLWENFPNKKYEIIYLDPPWKYTRRQYHMDHNKNVGRDVISAQDHYETVNVKDLTTLPIKNIVAKNCIMFMWTTGPKIPEAVHLIKHWKLKYVTVGFVWNKIKPNPGNYTMSECEYVLIARKGNIPQPRGLRNIRQLYPELKGKHSSKPIEFRNKIHKMFPTQSKIELFARWEGDDNWETWGKE